MKFDISEKVAPYEKFQYYNPKIKQIEQERSYAQNKTKKVSLVFSSSLSCVRSSMYNSHPGRSLGSYQIVLQEIIG